MYKAIFWAFFAILILSCKSGPIRESEKIKKTAESARAGNANAKKALLENLNPQHNLPPEVQAETLSELGPLSQDPEVKQKVRPLLHHEDPEVRTNALKLWISQKPTSEEITDILLTNGQKFSELTSYEYSLFSETTDIRLLEILKNHLGKNRQLDITILETVGKILKKNFTPKQTSPSLPADPKPQEFRDIFEEFLPTLEKGGIENDIAKKAEDILLNYAANSKEEELSQKALLEYEEATSPFGYELLLEKLGDRMLSQSLRLAILNYLEKKEKERKEKKLAKVLRKIKIWFSYEPEYLQRIHEVLGEFISKKLPEKPKETLEPGKETKKKNLVFKSKLTIQEKKKFGKLSDLEKLRFLFKKYSLPKDLPENIESHLKAILQDSSSGASRLLFACLSALYPQANYFELKKKSQESFFGFSFFNEVMQRIIQPQWPLTWQNLATQKIWGVSPQEAKILRMMYLYEFKN